MDVDECRSGRHDCVGNATCINTEGSYICTCDKGFEGNGTAHYTDIDECEKPFIACGKGILACTNLPGGYECDRCRTGYLNNGTYCQSGKIFNSSLTVDETYNSKLADRSSSEYASKVFEIGVKLESMFKRSPATKGAYMGELIESLHVFK